MRVGEEQKTRLPVEGTMQPCWSCKGPVATRALFCSTCGAVQKPGQIDHFSRLGLPRHFEISREALDRQYFGFQRRLHPDRFVRRSSTERALSQQQATMVNEAYEVLRDPLRRADYLLGLLGHGHGDHDRAKDPSLLMEMMERREELSEAMDMASAEHVAARVESDVLACQCAIATAFSSSRLDEAERLVERLKYLVRLSEEARARKKRLAAEKK